MIEERLECLVRQVDATVIDAPPLQQIRREAARQRQRTSVLVAAAAAVAVISAGGITAVQLNDEHDKRSSIASSADNDDEPPIRLTPATARPGDIVDVTFKDGASRGAGYRLESDQASYYIVADWSDVDRSQARPLWSKTPQVVGDMANGGPQPDRIIVPPIASPGDYVLCQLSTVEKCANLTVLE